jgi:hypothetical protein
VRGPIVGMKVTVQTELPRLQVCQAIELTLDGRQWEGGMVTSINLSLVPWDSGRAMLGPAEARELARYLTAMADTVATEGRP